MIILSFDFGMKNIGVAVGQNITYTAQSIGNIKSYSGKPDWKQIQKLINSWLPKLIIVGYPINMDGSMQKITYQAKKFSQDLYNKFLINVKLHDERLTTIESKSILYLQGGYKNLKKNKIDSLSAVLILEGWLKNNLI